jgi:uncharacterized protein YjbI with pentapeptide repeats
MGVIWLKFLILVILASLLSVVAIPVWAQESKSKQAETCLLPEGWDPAEDLPRILAEHRQLVEQWKANKEAEVWARSEDWARTFPQSRDNLCKANLTRANLIGAVLIGFNLNKADLSSAKLNGVNLSRAKLNGANLSRAELNGAILIEAKLNVIGDQKASLRGAKLNRAILLDAELNGADLLGAELNRANLSRAELNGADLLGAELNGTNLFKAELNGANLSSAKLNGADLSSAKLNGADLFNAELNGAKLDKVILADVRLDYTNLTNATYAPASPPPNSNVAGIQGLKTVTFSEGNETGLVQLRELLQKAGLRDLEREATYAIEHGRTEHLFDSWNTESGSEAEFDLFQAIKGVLQHFGDVAEGIFRLIAFEATTGYGLYPSMALGWIAIIGAGLILVYFWPIHHEPYPAKSSNGIYRIWSTDRIETSSDEIHGYEVEIKSKPKIECLHGGFWFALRYAAYFSLLSAFHFGWRDLNVGTWISRMQFREYALRATGWVRFVSGLQSLLSVYLLAIWALTYFGRPFQ